MVERYNDILEWHKKVLKERLEDYNKGNVATTSWEDFRKELEKEDEEYLAKDKEDE